MVTGRDRLLRPFLSSGNWPKGPVGQADVCMEGAALFWTDDTRRYGSVLFYGMLPECQRVSVWASHCRLITLNGRWVARRPLHRWW